MMIFIRIVAFKTYCSMKSCYVAVFIDIVAFKLLVSMETDYVYVCGESKNV